MSTAPKRPPTDRMTADEFMAWAANTPGRYELVSGTVHVMQPEPVEHGEVKGNCYALLRAAVSRANLPCHVLPYGMAVRATPDDVFEPDALVYCGERLPRGTTELDHPTVVVEVGSPSTSNRDQTFKLMGYMQIASLQHYVLVTRPSGRWCIMRAKEMAF